MELLSAPLHTGSVPWQRLLLTVSLVTYWSSPTTAQVHIEPVPPHVAEGKSVLLRVSNLSGNLHIIYCYKEKTTLDDFEIAQYIIKTKEVKPGSAHSGREMIFPNGSLLIQDVGQKDSGFYTLQTTNLHFDKEVSFVQFVVHQLVTQPSLHVTKSTVPEKGSVVFTCHSSDTRISIQWILNNQNLKLTERMTLSENNSRLSIEPVMGEDAGDYQCEVSNPVSSEKSAPVHLVVNKEQNPQCLPVWTVVLIVTWVLVAGTLVNALGCFLVLTKTSRASVQHDLRQPKPPVSTAGPHLHPQGSHCCVPGITTA